MSRLIDRITRIRQNEPQPIGFAALSRGAAEKPRMQVIACLNADNLAKISEESIPADAVLVEINKADDITALEKLCSAKNDIPIGGFLKASNSGTVKKAANVTCDFMVFPGTIAVTLTQKEKMGRILELDTSLNERFLRAAGELPIDAALAFDKSEDNYLTINRLMFFQNLVNSINKPVLVSIPINLTGAELQAIWDVGISGVVVELAEEESFQKVAELRESIEKLSEPSFRKKFRGSPTVPRMEPEPEKPAEEEGDGEEDE